MVLEQDSVLVATYVHARYLSTANEYVHGQNILCCLVTLLQLVILF